MIGNINVDVRHLIWVDGKKVGVGLEELDELFFHGFKKVGFYIFHFSWILFELDNYEFNIWDWCWYLYSSLDKEVFLWPAFVIQCGIF